MKRLILLVVSVVVALAAAIWFLKPTHSSADAPHPGQLVLFQWEDYMNPPFLHEYERKYKEPPKITIFADEDEAFAKMRAGFTPDVMGPCYYEFPRWQEAGLLEPIDTKKLKNWDKISPTLRNLPGIDAGHGKVWFVPHYWGNTSITFRTDLAPEYVQHPSWNILFDPKYKGRVSVLEGVDDTVPFVAHMIGIDAYHMTPAQWEHVQAKLRELVPQTRTITSDDSALVQGLASGEIVAAMTWRIVYSSLKRENKPVAFMNPPGGMFTYVCGLTMHKNPSSVEKATALIDSMIGDEGAIYTIEEIGDEPANEGALVREPDEIFIRQGLDRDMETMLKSGIFQKRLKNKEEVVSAWTEIRAGL
ncbi:MAG: extracellular solute-binding protein [Alphaproteobacteria bacterium]|nr:extracellular solute-binding protein [Alphaproteobacteria bacterium]